MNELQKFIWYSKYARYNWDLGRRETWEEAIDRVMTFLIKSSSNLFPQRTYERIRKGMLNRDVAPSMRLLNQAGVAAERNGLSIFNCSYVPIDSLDSFSDITFTLLSGTGVGFSVETQHVEKFPEVAQFRGKVVSHTVEDTSEGWADAVRFVIRNMFNGNKVSVNYRKVRAAGMPLKVKGGTSAGPEPLMKTITNIKDVIERRRGKPIRSIDLHDIVCWIADGVVSGGQRRCLNENTRIHTDTGTIPIKDVTIGMNVLTANGNRKVMDVFNQGEQQTVHVNLETGMHIKCTPNHRIAVLTSVNGEHIFKRADELTSNDKLLFVTDVIDVENASQDLLPLPDFSEMDMIKTHVEQPVLDTETAWFLGKFFADGTVGSYERKNKPGQYKHVCRIAFNSNEADEIHRVEDWARSIGVEPRTYYRPNENTADVSVGPSRFVRWMLNYKQANTELVIPNEIWTASSDVRAAFVAGVMDGDGAVNNRPVVVVSTIYKTFAEDMVRLVATLGVPTKLKLNRPARGNWKALYHVTLNDGSPKTHFNDSVGLYMTKNMRIGNSARNSFRVDRRFVASDVPIKNYSGNIVPLSQIEKTYPQTNYVPISVVNVTPGSVVNTYDIEVEDEHAFVAEGILVHNSATISVFSKDDELMLNAKTGDWFTSNPQRMNANNSVVIPPDYDDEWLASYVGNMLASDSGEPGIINPTAFWNLMPEQRQRLYSQEEVEETFKVNPCGEVILRPHQVCNLSMAIPKPTDSVDELAYKVALATAIGVLQADVTNLAYVSDEWHHVLNSERLLGVSLTGFADGNPHLLNPEVLSYLKQVARQVSEVHSEFLGMDEPTALTTVKPSGNSSLLYNVGSGIHSWHAPFFIRNTMLKKDSALYQLLSYHDAPMVDMVSNHDFVLVQFPVKAPQGAILRNDLTAIEQLERWWIVQENYVEHAVSATITYNEGEIPAISRWLVRNIDMVTGLSFLKNGNTTYPQMPLEEINEEEYYERVTWFPEVDYSLLSMFEGTDTTESSGELACVGGSCEVDFTPNMETE